MNVRKWTKFLCICICLISVPKKGYSQNTLQANVKSGVYIYPYFGGKNTVLFRGGLGQKDETISQFLTTSDAQSFISAGFELGVYKGKHLHGINIRFGWDESGSTDQIVMESDSIRFASFFHIGLVRRDKEAYSSTSGKIQFSFGGHAEVFFRRFEGSSRSRDFAVNRELLNIERLEFGLEFGPNAGFAFPVSSRSILSLNIQFFNVQLSSEGLGLGVGHVGLFLQL